MNAKLPNIKEVIRELTFSSSRSSGPGGQNVNKVNSKVILKWDVSNSAILNDDQRKLILDKLNNWLTKEGVLLLSSQDSRSQSVNKEVVVEKLEKLLRKVFTFKKKRKPTKPTKSSVRNRVTEKKRKGEKKQWRQKPDL